jgi:aryl-alcohol dehydrogenase-like predicted oxidoreductase
VIAGASSPQQLDANLAALAQPLPAEALQRLAEATDPVTAALGPNADMWQTQAASRFR